MLQKLLLLMAFLSAYLVHPQVIYEVFNSSQLGEERELKIQLPRNYDTNTQKIYPLIIVLDGDYLFEPMAGNVDYYSYWDEIPESIVVGINQVSTREIDSYYGERNYLPAETGASFFEFIGMELLPYLDNKFRTARFAVIAGHDLTANFINYYLLKKDPLFSAYINLSPDLAPEMPQRLHHALSTAESKKWFYLATASNDIPELKEAANRLDEQLRTIENKNFHYSFREFENANHYTMVGRAIPHALEKIFAAYRPIGMEEYNAIVINSEISAYDYLLEKYQTIEDYFGMAIPIRINDFVAIGKALEFVQDWDELEKLGDLAREHYPNSMLGTYYQARSYEAKGRTKKAMETYMNAYGQEEVAFLTIDFMLKKAEMIKQDFGY